MAIFIRLRRDKMGRDEANHKYYAHIVQTGDVDTEMLAERIQRNTTFTRGEVRGIIDSLVDEMKRQMSDGHTVVLNGLGRFHLSVESEGAESPELFDIQRDIKRVVCKYRPAGSRVMGRGSRIVQLFGKDIDVLWYPGCENGRNLDAPAE